MNRGASIAVMLCVGALATGCSRFDYGGSPLASPPPVASAPRQPVAPGNGLQPLVVSPPQDQAGLYGPGGAPVSGGTLGPDGRPIGVDGRPLDDPNATAPQERDVAAVDSSSTPQSAAPAAPSGAPEIGRTELLGGWTLRSSGGTCKLFMTLTTWSGGYRANTQGCASQPEAAISAWDLNGSQIVLKDSDGASLATLYKSAAERYDGRTGNGQSISFYR